MIGGGTCEGAPCSTCGGASSFRCAAARLPCGNDPCAAGDAGDRVALRLYRFSKANHTSAIDECTKKTIQATSSTSMTPIIIRGHTRWNRRSRGIAAGLPVAVALVLGSEVVGPRLGSGG